MNLIARIEAYRQARRQSAWYLMALDHAPVVLGLLSHHLTGTTRTLPASVLYQRLEQNLEDLRIRGFDLPQTAQAYVSQWLGQGFLERDFPSGATEEEFELSILGHQAIRLANSLIESKSVATESRLSTVIQQLQQLVTETDPSQQNRIRSLEQEKRKIDQQIDAIRKGHSKELDTERALERIRDIIYLSRDLTEDFRLVREEFRHLNTNFRKQILESEGSRGDVLERLFEGVDVIANSDAGKTFRAFWRLLTDSKLNADFESALDTLLSRHFTTQLSPQERVFLIRLSQILLERGKEVHDVLDGFSRSLKQFVQKRDYQEKRRLTKILDSTHKQALHLKDVLRSFDDLGFQIELTGGVFRSVAQLELFDPEHSSYERVPMKDVVSDLSLQTITSMVESSEIDFRTLIEQILYLLDHSSQVSIADVLDIYPAQQGLGSVVGLISLGLSHGEKTNSLEKIAWPSEDLQRTATIPKIYFTQEKRHELALRI